MKQNEGKKERKSLIFRFLNTVEQVGNRLPHPITMFAALALFIVLLSGILAAAGISAEGEVIDSKTMEVTTQTVSAVSLLDRDGLVYMLTHMVSNFTEFAPLGVVLVTMLGVGCAEGSGYLSALLKKTVSVTPAKLVTPMLVFLGVMSNVASDVGYVVLIPLGAMVFLACGRHPIAGIAAAFAGVSGGFSANLLIGTLDPMLAGISTEAAQLVSPGYIVEPSANWYFMIVSTFLIVALGSWVTDRIVEPRLTGGIKAKPGEGGQASAAGEPDGYNWCTVLTVVDTSTSMGAQVFRTKDLGVAVGDFSLMGDGRLRMDYLPADCQLLGGDLVVTSGLGGYYPSGLVIGSVEEVQKDDSGASSYAVLVPEADLDSLTEVAVIKSFDIVS